MLGGDDSIDHFNSSPTTTTTTKRKRRPAGTPDPDAEVVSLSPKTLMESDRYICEICNQGFQRDQNLQMHRRRHKVPWKLLKRENNNNNNNPQKKRVFVCPEPSCLHHQPCHALGDLVGIKKHFRRKHSNNKQWVCQKCCKAYAVHSDYKAHLKTCGTRGHSCDCGRVFSRVESFIEHQDTCHISHLRPPPSHDHQHATVVCLSRATSISSPLDETHGTQTPGITATRKFDIENHNLDLKLSVSPQAGDHHDNQSTQLQLSIGSSDFGENHNPNNCHSGIGTATSPPNQGSLVPVSINDKASEKHMRMAILEKAYAEEARREAKRQMEIAEREFANAKQIREQAQADVERAMTLKEHAMKFITSTLLQITCHACKQHFRTTTSTTIGTIPQIEDQTSSLGESQIEDEHNQQ